MQSLIRSSYEMQFTVPISNMFPSILVARVYCGLDLGWWIAKLVLCVYIHPQLLFPGSGGEIRLWAGRMLFVSMETVSKRDFTVCSNTDRLTFLWSILPGGDVMEFICWVSITCKVVPLLSWLMLDCKFSSSNVLCCPFLLEVELRV